MSRTYVPSWRSARSLPIRGKRAFKELVKSMVTGLVRTMPNASFRTAAFVEHIVGEQLRQQRRRSVSVPLRQIETIEPSSKRQALEALLAEAQSQLEHPDILALFARAGHLSDAKLHRYLTTLFVARRIDVMAAVVGHTALGFSTTRLYHRLKLEQYRGIAPTSAAAIGESYQQLSRHPLFSDAALNLTIDTFCRLGDAPALADFLADRAQDTSHAAFSRIAPATFLGCCRLLERAGLAEQIEPWRQAFLAPLTTEQQLYHLDILPLTVPERRQAAADWRSILTTFAQAYSAADAADHRLITQAVFAPLARLPVGRQDYMNIRFDPDAKSRLMSVIDTALRIRQPLALVRLGDGEGYGYDLPASVDLSARDIADDNAIRERMWWGSTIPASDRLAMTALFRQAVAEADIVGMPSIYRIIRDRGTPGTRYGETGGQRGLAVVLAQLGSTIPLSAMFTEERCHQLLFDRETIERLASLAERVVLVSCWRRDQVGLVAKDIQEIIIPPHTKVAGATGQMVHGSLATNFAAQVAEMAKHCAPGTLVLVGAGFIGKIFLGEARRRGAVALDVGAVLDYMAGYKTRSLADLA